MDVGLELRQARERRGISLLQLSNATKISPRVLDALEASDERRLPALVFVRGFVKAYAAEVGLDPEDTLRRYQFQVLAPRDAGAGAPEAEQDPVEPAPEPLRHSPARVLQGRFGTATVLTLVSVSALALAIGQKDSLQAGPEVPVATAGLVPAVPAQPAAVGTSGTTPAPDVLHITIAPTGPCWVQASSGDSRLFAGLLNAGDRRTIDSPSGITLRVGDPTTFAFTINGRRARIQGVQGQAVTERITRENYTQFLMP